MRCLVLLLACISTAAVAQTPPPPISSPPPSTLGNAPKLPPAWEQRAREIYKTAVEIPTVAGRGQMPKLANYLADQLRAAGWADSDIHVLPYVSPGDDQHRGAHRPLAGRRDAQEEADADHRAHGRGRGAAERLDDRSVHAGREGRLLLRPREQRRQGRAGAVDGRADEASPVRLQARPRHHPVLYTGDEETEGKGAELGATEWRKWTEAEFVLNADAGGGAFTRDGKPLGFGLQTSEKTFQSYYFRVRNPGGHSSRPRPDNAIYDLADALKKLQQHRFTPDADGDHARSTSPRGPSRRGTAPSGRRCGAGSPTRTTARRPTRSKPTRSRWGSPAPAASRRC